jgi:hypothetical protein
MKVVIIVPSKSDEVLNLNYKNKNKNKNKNHKSSTN